MHREVLSAFPGEELGANYIWPSEEHWGSSVSGGHVGPAPWRREGGNTEMPPTFSSPTRGEGARVVEPQERQEQTK